MLNSRLSQIPSCKAWVGVLKTEKSLICRCSRHYHDFVPRAWIVHHRDDSPGYGSNHHITLFLQRGNDGHSLHPISCQGGCRAQRKRLARWDCCTRESNPQCCAPNDFCTISTLTTMACKNKLLLSMKHSFSAS